MQTIADRLESIPEVFRPLREHAGRYVQFGTATDDAGVVAIGPNPAVAPLFFVFRLYPPACAEWLIRPRGYAVPIEYLRFLACTNGCFAYGMSLYGFTPSIEGDAGLLDRTVLQCHDLSTANEAWISDFQVPEDLFYFGGRHYSFSENAGYFMSGSGRVCSFLKSGKEVGRWDNLTQFLQEELAAAEAYYKANTPG